MDPSNVSRSSSAGAPASGTSVSIAVASPTTATTVKIETRPAVAASVAISRPGAPAAATIPVVTSSASSATSGATSVPITSVAATASPATAAAPLLPTIFSLSVPGSGGAGVTGQAAVTGLHPSPQVSLTPSQLLPPPQLQQQQLSATLSATAGAPRTLLPSPAIAASSSIPITGVLPVGASQLASGTAASGSVNSSGGGTSLSITTGSGALPVGVAAAPALSWQCSHSLLFVGNSRNPEELVSTQLTQIGPFSKSSSQSLVVTAPYAAALREEAEMRKLQATIASSGGEPTACDDSAVSANARLRLLQRKVRAELIDTYVKHVRSTAALIAVDNHNNAVAAGASSSTNEGVAEAKAEDATAGSEIKVEVAAASRTPTGPAPVVVSVHPPSLPVLGLLPRRTVHTFRTRRQQKRDVKNYDKEITKKTSVREDVLKKKQSAFLKDIMTYRDSFIRYHKSKRMECSRISRATRLWLESQEARKEKMDARAEQRRLQALRDQDMVAYNQLVMETKNVRLKYLLSQTEGYIQTIHKMIEEQRIANAPAITGQEGDQGSEVQLSGAGGTMSQKYFESTHRLVEQVVQPHILKGGDLKEYQLAGLQWLVSLHNNNLNGILADEMGLGKTIQAISLLAYITEFKNNHGPYLVVVPLSTLSNWVNEFTKWVPEMTRVVYKGAPPTRKALYKEVVEPGHFNVLITTYEYIMKDKALLKKPQWEYIIVDEGHRMKNAQSKFAQILGSQYTSKHRILLTGTPLQNNLPELWSLLNFLLPSIFNSVDTFDQWFNKPFASFRQSQASTGPSGDDGEMVSLTQEERLLIVQRLHEVLRPFMLRRVKSQVLDQLPAKTEMVLRCELSGWQRKLYQTVQQRCARTIKALLKPNEESDAVQRSTSSGSLNELGNADMEGMEGDPEDSNAGAPSSSVGAEAMQLASANSTGLNNVIMQLRKICNHPYLFMSDWNIDDDLIRSSGKFELLDRMLPKLKAAGHRVLMFSQMTQLMTILERFFELRGFTFLRLDGSTQSDEREKRMYEFNDPNSPYFIFLLSTRAGGLGLNLATADTVFLFDSDWNPMMDAQAQGRAHRIGQKNAVRVFRLVTTSPVEERILARATEKLNLTELVVEAGKFNKNGSNDFDDRKELVEALLMEYAESKEVDEEGGAATESLIPDEDQLNEMMALHESEVALYQKMDAALAERRSKEWALTNDGKTGAPIPPRLMPADNLPPWIETGACWHPKYGKMFIPPTFQEAPPPELDSEGNVVSGRKRKWDGVAVYNENMTDAEFDVFIGERAGGRASRGGGTAKRGRGASGRGSAEAGEAPVAAVPKVPRAPGSWLRGRRPSRGRGRSAAAGRGRGSGSGSGRGGGRGVRVLPGTIPMGITQALIRIMLALRKIPRIDGSMLSTLFLDLPDAKHYPDYYTIVTNPVSLKTITRKLRDAKYNSTSELTAELNTMVQNALLYNGSESPVYKDALAIQERYLQQVFALGISIDESGKEHSAVALDESPGVGNDDDDGDDGDGRQVGDDGEEDVEGDGEAGEEGYADADEGAAGEAMDESYGDMEIAEDEDASATTTPTPAAKRVRLSMPSDSSKKR